MTNLVATYTPSTTRSDDIHDVGFKFTFTGTTGSVVTQLGLWKTTGNTGNWTVSLRNASNTQILASAVIDMTAATAGQFNYATAVIPATAKGALAMSSSDAAVYFLVVNIPAGQTYPDTTPVTLNNASTAVGVFSVPNAVGSGVGSASGTNNQFGGVDLVFTTPAAAGPGNLVVAYDPNVTRSDNNNDLGFKFVYTGTTGMVVTKLGAWKVSGDTGTWTVSLRSSGNAANLASVTISMAGATAGQFNYADVASPPVLTNGSTYFLVVNIPAGQALQDLGPMALNSGSTIVPVYAVPAAGGGVGNTNASSFNTQYAGVDLVFGPAVTAAKGGFFFG